MLYRYSSLQIHYIYNLRIHKFTTPNKSALRTLLLLFIRTKVFFWSNYYSTLKSEKKIVRFSLFTFRKTPTILKMYFYKCILKWEYIVQKEILSTKKRRKCTLYQKLKCVFLKLSHRLGIKVKIIATFRQKLKK